MQVRPILSAMMRNKVAPSLIAAQIAITLAVLCNALFIIQQRLSYSRRPAGTDEANLFYISYQWVGHNGDLDPLEYLAIFSVGKSVHRRHGRRGRHRARAGAQSLDGAAL
jgi:hypothetical protein